TCCLGKNNKKVMSSPQHSLNQRAVRNHRCSINVCCCAKPYGIVHAERCTSILQLVTSGSEPNIAFGWEMMGFLSQVTVRTHSSFGLTIVIISSRHPITRNRQVRVYLSRY